MVVAGVYTAIEVFAMLAGLGVDALADVTVTLPFPCIDVVS
jgi:hypothetical protein